MIVYAGLLVWVAWLIFYLKQVDISLIYYWQQTVPPILVESMEYPGGMARLLATWFNEGLTLPFWGSAAVFTMLSFTYLLLRRIFIPYGKITLFHPLLLAALIPFVLMLASYRLPMELSFCLFTGLMLTGLFTLYTPGNLYLKLVCIFTTGIITYLLAGPVGLIVCIQVCIIQSMQRRTYAHLMAALPLLLVIPLAYLLVNPAVTIKQAYLGSFIISKYDEIPATYFISLSIPLVLLILFQGSGRLFSKTREKRILWLEGIGLAMATGAMVFFSLGAIDREERTRLQIEQASFNDDWPKILALADEKNLQNKVAQFEVNRALFHKGLLLEELFRYPQIFGEQSIFMEQVFSGRNGTHVSDFYADLGFANESRHWANESHMIMKGHPIILKQLILSYLAMDKEDIAVKYLGILSRSSIHKGWCDQILESIKQNTLNGIPSIRAFTENNPEDDFFPSPSNPIQGLTYFNIVNPTNRAAFEFLMASNLLKHQLGPVISHIKDFQRFGYSHLPRSIEEAVMIYINQTKSTSLDLAGYNIRPETVSEFKDFTQLIATSKSRSEAKDRVAKYRQTYWYYIMYSSPYVKKANNRE